MATIYTTDAWAASTTYVKNSKIIINNNYYYSLIGHTSTSSFTTDLTNGKWGGILVSNGESKPHFIWTPDYGYSFDIEPTVSVIQFGDNYAQYINTNINNILLKGNLTFSNRDINEYTAILHFLDARRGSEKFFFVPASPYNVTKKFICKSWKPTQQFYNNYSVQCEFQECQ